MLRKAPEPLLSYPRGMIFTNSNPLFAVEQNPSRIFYVVDAQTILAVIIEVTIIVQAENYPISPAHHVIIVFRHRRTTIQDSLNNVFLKIVETLEM